MGYLEKFASYQGNKEEDIDKRRKKKKDVQVSNTPRATQTFVHIENLEHDVNLELSEFRNSPNCVVLLSHCRTHEGGHDLCRSHPRFQIGDLIFNHLKAQNSLATTRPWG